MRLLYVGNAPVRYHTPVFNALSKHVDLHVLFMTRTDRIYGFRDAWGVEPEFAHSYYWSCALPVAALDTRIQLSVGVSQRIHRLKPDVIVVHSWQPIGVEPVAWARLTRSAASVMWAESWARSGRLRGRIPTGLRRAFVRNVDAFVSSGSQATAYLRFLGVEPDRIVTSCYPSPLQQPPSCVAANTRSEITRFLYVGRLVPRKRPVEVLRAFADVKRARPATTLDIVGDGPLAADVRQLAETIPGARYRGHLEGDDLSTAYAKADVLVFPATREGWGLVVNEALAHGLYVIAGDGVGSAYDLLDETSGRMVPASSLSLLTSAMVETVDSVDRSGSARAQRMSRVRCCTPENFARDLVEAAQRAVGFRSGSGISTSRVAP